MTTAWSTPSRRWRRLPDLDRLEHRGGGGLSSQGHGAEVGPVGRLLTGAVDRPGPGEHAAGPTLGHLGEAGGLVHGAADHGVLVALLGTDVAGHEQSR